MIINGRKMPINSNTDENTWIQLLKILKRMQECERKSNMVEVSVLVLELELINLNLQELSTYKTIEFLSIRHFTEHLVSYNTKLNLHI